MKPSEEPQSCEVLRELVLVAGEAELGAEVFEAPALSDETEFAEAVMTSVHHVPPMM